jgi:hypothetical protein
MGHRTDAADDGDEFFVTSARCIACHSNLHTADGQDVSIGYAWRASMMANSARDPYWHAAVRREVVDHPDAGDAIEDKCSTCHMPMQRFTAVRGGGSGRVFASLGTQTGSAPDTLAIDGVSCTVCHQIEPDNLGAPSSFDGGFLIDAATAAGERPLYGPHQIDAGRQHVMQSAGRFVPGEGTHVQLSELCATCHTLFTNALDANGREVGELPEQVPFLEWQHSAYRDTQSCQSCHMPKVEEQMPISSVLGQPRPALAQHVFRGGNAFMLGILNGHRDELGVRALPQELGAAIERTRQYLATDAARVTIESAQVAAQRLTVTVAVANLAGHKLPTAYPSRRAWLHLRVTDASGRALFESGGLQWDGSIAGNDNDADAARWEPHFDVIERADQVQIYEPILVDSNDRVTTGLLSAVRYVKDNRLLPGGFDKETMTEDIAVRGEAATDPDFVGGSDHVEYRIDLEESTGDLVVEAELLYQTIGFRWKENLRSYDTHETNRFVGYYEESAASSSSELAAATLTIARPRLEATE